jgi:hypothetical protein
MQVIERILRGDPTVSEEQRGAVLRTCQLTPGAGARRRLGTAKRAAEVLGVCIRTLERYAREGKVTRIRYSQRRVRYDLEQVEELARHGIAE